MDDKYYIEERKDQEHVWRWLAGPIGRSKKAHEIYDVLNTSNTSQIRLVHQHNTVIKHNYNHG